MLRLYHLSDTLGARIEDSCNVPSDLDADQERTLKSPCPQGLVDGRGIGGVRLAIGSGDTPGDGIELLP